MPDSTSGQRKIQGKPGPSAGVGNEEVFEIREADKGKGEPPDGGPSGGRSHLSES